MYNIDLIVDIVSCAKLNELLIVADAFLISRSSWPVSRDFLFPLKILIIQVVLIC